MSEQEQKGSPGASSAGVNAPAKVPAAGCDESVRCPPRGPDEDDDRVYRCNRAEPHTTLHAEIAGKGDIAEEGEVLAWWCSCPDCAAGEVTATARSAWCPTCSLPKCECPPTAEESAR